MLTYEDILAFIDITAALEERGRARPTQPTPRPEPAADARRPARPDPKAAAGAEPEPRRPLDIAA